jgi:tryptophan halogenase
MSPIQKVIVLGSGSAGLIAALTLKRTFPQLDVKVIRSPEIGIIGVGEGTTPAFGDHLFGPLKLSLKEFHEKAKPTWKLGLRFIWGPRQEFHFTFQPLLQTRRPDLRRNHAYYCEENFDDANQQSALMRRNKAFPAGPDGKRKIDLDIIAYHMENVNLVSYLEWRAREDGVEFVDATVETAGREGDRITWVQLAGGERVEADFFVDSSGFRAFLIGQVLKEPFVSYKDVLYCDRAVIGPRDREADEPIRPYTTVETMEAGWCWRIDHEHHVNRGYVYSSEFISDADAEAEFRKQNPKVNKTRVVKFKSGRYERAWVGNVVAVGNSSGFVEPLEATALGNLCTECRNMAVVLHETALAPTPTAVGVYNNLMGKEWDDIRDFLAVHYKFNTLKDNEFWRKCRADIPLRTAEPLLDFYRENGPSWLANNTIFTGLHQFGLESYYTMFLGMKLPNEKPHKATPEERSRWEAIKADWVRLARNGITVREGLDIIRNPDAAWAQPKRAA